MSNREETILELYFQLLAQLSFDKAKELVDKEKETKVAGDVWQQLMGCLSQLATGDKAYASLLFLMPKGFLRKDTTLKSIYENLKVDLVKLEEASSGQSHHGAVSDRLFGHLAKQITEYVSARIFLVDFYESLYTSGGRQLATEDVLNLIGDIVKQTNNCFHHPLLANLKAAYSLECEVLQKQFEAQLNLQNWKFLPSLLSLNEANGKLQVWDRSIAKDPQRTSLLRPTASNLPNVHQWLLKFQSSLVSKFSLYFYDVLVAQSNPQEMKQLCSHQTVDYCQKIQQFQKKTDAHAVALVFDATEAPDYKGRGYHHPDEYCEQLKGLDLYPAVFSWPAKPTGHWPSIVMILTDRTAELTATDGIVYFFDTRVQSTYFLTRVDPFITLVVVFEARKSDRDSTVTNFMNDLCQQLRGCKVFGSLKPGYKA